MIDLRKYDGRYVEIMYGPQKIIGKLCIGEETKIENALLATGYHARYLSVHDYIGVYARTRTFWLRKGKYNWEKVIRTNERNINTLKDVTEEIYHAISSEKSIIDKRIENCETSIREYEKGLNQCSRFYEEFPQLYSTLQKCAKDLGKFLCRGKMEKAMWLANWENYISRFLHGYSAYSGQLPFPEPPERSFDDFQEWLKTIRKDCEWYKWYKWYAKERLYNIIWFYNSPTAWFLEKIKNLEDDFKDKIRRLQENNLSNKKDKERLEQLEKDIEQIKEAEKKKEEKPKRKPSFIYSP